MRADGDASGGRHRPNVGGSRYAPAMSTLRVASPRLAWVGAGHCLLLGCLLSACSDDPDCPACEITDAEPGEVAWQEAFHARFDDHAWAIAVDPVRGHVAVAGGLGGYDQSETDDIWIGLLSHGGTPQWDTTIHEIYDDYASAVAFDESGALWVAGATDLGPYVGSDNRAGWLGRFTPRGAESWRVRHAEEGDDPDGNSFGFRAVVVAPDGRAFVAGTRTQTYSSTAVAAAYGNDGVLAWTSVRDDSDGSSDLQAVFVLPSTDVLFVGGQHATGGATGRTLLMQRFTRDGGLVSEHNVPGLQAFTDAFALRPDGDTLVVRTAAALVEVSVDGDVLREVAFDEGDDPSAAAVGIDGDVFVVGARRLGMAPARPWVARFDREFTKVWDYEADRAGSARAVAVGPNGDVFVAGDVEAPPTGGASDFTNEDIWIARLAR